MIFSQEPGEPGIVAHPGAFMPSDPPAEPAIDLADEAATCRFGEDLAMALRRGDVVALSGDLGAGKSTLARAVIRALCKDDALEVPSPTYTLVQAYECELPVTHFDLYRLGDPAGLDELGFDDAVQAGVVLCEWPERAEAVLQEATLTIRLQPTTSGGRAAFVEGQADALARLERSLAARAFLDAAPGDAASRRRFTGDASSRRYETVRLDGRTAVLMDAPRQPDGPPVRNGLPYSQIANLAEDVVPFVGIARLLKDGGFCAPEIYASDLEEGFVLLQHLGAEGIVDRGGKPVAERYEAACLCLADLHSRDWPREAPVADGRSFPIPPYDRSAFMIEAELLLDWYAPHRLGRTVTEADRRIFTETWETLIDELETGERTLVLRDYHSPNIIWRPEAEGCDRIGLIDFQDAQIGPSAYDVASLAQDARTDIAPELEARLVAAYAARRRDLGAFDAALFERDYAIVAAQRASKVLGIFTRLNLRDGKPQYLRHIPRIKAYLNRTLGHPSLGALRLLYEDWGLTQDDPSELFPASGR